MRLMEFLKRLKALFDNRVRVTLTSEKGFPSEVEHICDQDFSTLESPCKIIINEETSNKSRCAEFEIKKLLVDKEVESLKNIISENQTRWPNAKATEIVQKSIPKLHIKQTVCGGVDSWKFTASILKPNIFL